MADAKISALPASTTPLAGSETLPIVQSGVTKQVSVASLTAGRAVATAGGTFTGNLVQGVAVKGINFTANTPAAGMTSQLLNDYQEGTFTATDSSGAGLTLTQNIVAQYRKVGNLVFVTFDVTYPITANTAATSIAMPFSSAVFASGSVGFTTFGSAPGVIFSGSNATLYNLSTGSTITNVVASGKRFSISGCFSV